MRKLLIIPLLLIVLMGRGQDDRLIQIEQQLNTLAMTTPGLNESVEISVDGITLQEFVRSLAELHQLNISASEDLAQPVYNNFSNARVRDVLLFLCKEYSLQAEFIGTIISFRKYVASEPEPEPFVSAKPGVVYVMETEFLSLDLRNDSIEAVVEEITRQSDRNVILAPGLSDQKISVFIQNRPFDAALEKMAYANGLKVTKTSDSFYLLSVEEVAEFNEENIDNTTYNGGMVNMDINPGMTFNKTEGGLITVDAVDVPIADMISYVSHQLFKNYFMYTKPQGNATLYVENATYDDFLSFLLNGSDYTYKSQDDVYLLGERTLEGLRATKLIQFENRALEDMIQYIPADMKKGVEIKEFVDLNGVIVSGSYLALSEIEAFIREIDKVVPMVLIEVMIVDVANTTTFTGGVSMGIGTGPAESAGTISGSGGVDFNFTSESVNDLINGINGYGFINLGHVVPDFYMSIKALEADGSVDVKSTPKLSTLNGHQASLTIGEQEYYLETANNFIGSENPQQVITNTYKATSANLSITILPVVSSDDQVTLDITVQQSDFTERISENAPPGTVTRTFDSMIRVKDGETILLGGLEEKSTSDSGSGVPFLSKIPILKWFFSNRTKEKSKQKLTIFIKPTIIY